MSWFKFGYPTKAVRIVSTGLLAGSISVSAVYAEPAQVDAPQTMLVHVDQAHILRLDEPAGSIIIGNPMIADATVQDTDMLVITGKSYGTTNLIILDGRGNELASRTIEVRFSAQSQVTVQRGTGRFSYACAPKCEPVLAIGDHVDQFNQVMESIAGRNETATGQTAPQN